MYGAVNGNPFPGSRTLVATFLIVCNFNEGLPFAAALFFGEKMPIVHFFHQHTLDMARKCNTHSFFAISCPLTIFLKYSSGDIFQHRSFMNMARQNKKYDMLLQFAMFLSKDFSLETAIYTLKLIEHTRENCSLKSWNMERMIFQCQTKIGQR